MLLLGKGELLDRFRIEWHWAAPWAGYWGRWLGQHRIYWHLGPVVISWVRKD